MISALCWNGYLDAYIYMCVCVCVCVCAYIYIYICVCVCVYIYVALYIVVQACISKQCFLTVYSDGCPWKEACSYLGTRCTSKIITAIYINQT